MKGQMEDLSSFSFYVEAPQRNRPFKSTHAYSFTLPVSVSACVDQSPHTEMNQTHHLPFD